MTSAGDALKRFVGVDVWVVGDVMLDEYVEGDVDRVSPEAPVPVVRERSRFERVGGAANVASSARALGARVALAGVVGNDGAGARLGELLAEAGIDRQALQVSAGRPTTVKRRILSRGQQLLRIERESREEVSENAWAPALATLTAGPRPDVIILSDYDKGMLGPDLLQQLLRFARSVRVPVVCDPKHGDFARYRGVTLLTPNLAEVERAARSGHLSGESLEHAARKLLETAEAEAMVVTLGADGVLLVPAVGPARHVPAIAREVYDPTGAGDTVTAVLALAIARNLDLPTSALLANAAAGVAVGRVGAVAVTPAEIAASLEPDRRAGVLERSELLERVDAWRLGGRRIVFTNGCFDILHSGHVSLLAEAARLGDKLVVAINSDDSVTRLKGAGRPLMPATERARLLAALRVVDAVVVFEEDTPYELIALLRPEVLVKGGDYSPDSIVGAPLVASWGGEVVIVPLVENRSTSSLVERIRTS
jgi:D-beta-D-heptose 7-phosphate kinase/D-beta-D-heptose 1-phosphate adenosyltransferase